MAASQTWAKEVEALLRAAYSPGQVFSISDAYLLIPGLSDGRRDASNVNARIRDALQQLKHQGKLEFMSKRATYKLLKERR